MTSRVRRSTATPAASRTTRLAFSEPQYEQPQFTLNPNAQRQLAELSRKYNLKKLDDRFEEAQAAISNCASEVNDRLTERKTPKNKRTATQAATQDGEAEGGAEGASAPRLDELEAKVAHLTQRMDEGMRKLIDGQHSVQAMGEQLGAVAQDARTTASTQASTQAARSQPCRRRDTDGDEDMSGEDNTEEYEDFTPTDPAGATQTAPSVSGNFMRKVEDASTRYQSYTMTQRYAQNNNYRNFKGLVHAAQHPDEEVPLPHESEWFGDGGRAPAPGITRPGAANGGDAVDDDDDDIQIQRATTSTKCPLTLQEFKEPLTSTKCSHSFEASAILEMITRSSERDGGHMGPRGMYTGGEKAVRCPVSSCNAMLTKASLHKDMVIIHRIKRLQRAKQLEEQEDDEHGDGEGGRGDTTVIDDEEDDAADVDDYEGEERVERVKAEPRSTVGTGMAATQRPPQSSAVVNLGEGTDEGDE